MANESSEIRKQIIELLKTSGQIIDSRVRYSPKSGDFSRIEDLLEALALAQIATATTLLYTAEAK